MAETAKITLYSIKRCGYYSWAGHQPEFGELAEVLAALQRWVTGKELAATKTYEPAEDSVLLPAYLMNIEAMQNTWLLTIWNQVPDTAGTMPSVSANSRVGAPEVHLNEIAAGSIPGFASYFWLDVDRSLLASVKFNHLLGGVNQFNHFMQGYLRACSPWCIYEDDPNGHDVVVTGYRRDVAEQPQDLSPRFQSAMITKVGPRQELLDKCGEITKVHRKTVLQLNRGDQTDLWQTLLSKAGLRRVPIHRDTVRLAYEMPVQLNRDQLQEILDVHDDANYISEWEDVGLQLRGDPTIKWLNRAIARADFDLEIERDNAEVVNGQSLLRELLRQRDAILRTMQP